MIKLSKEGMSKVLRSITIIMTCDADIIWNLDTEGPFKWVLFSILYDSTDVTECSLASWNKETLLACFILFLPRLTPRSPASI